MNVLLLIKGGGEMIGIAGMVAGMMEWLNRWLGRRMTVSA